MLFLDHRGDLGALLSRELGARASLTSRLGLVGLRLGSRLGLAIHATLRLRVRAAVAAFSLHAVAVFAAFGLHVLAGGALFMRLRAHALRLFALHVVVLGGFLALHAGLHVVLRTLVLGGAGLHLFVGLGGLHATLIGALVLRGTVAIHRGCRRRASIGRRRTLLDGGARRRRFAARPCSLCVGEPGPGDQRRRGHRDHKTISHGIVSSRVCIARANNESRCAMFPHNRGSIGFVFVNAR